MRVSFNNSEYSVNFEYKLKKYVHDIENQEIPWPTKVKEFRGKEAMKNFDSKIYTDPVEEIMHKEEFVTICTIKKVIEPKNYEFISSGVTTRSQKDIMKKGTGRKMSLKRALMALPEDLNTSDFRLCIWTKYLADHKFKH